MNRQAVYHSIKSNYSFPVSDNELVIRLRVAKGGAQKVELIHSMKYDWTIRRECCAMRKEYSDGLFDYFIVKMCLQDTRFAYIFRIESEGGLLLFFRKRRDGGLRFQSRLLQFFSVSVHQPGGRAQESFVGERSDRLPDLCGAFFRRAMRGFFVIRFFRKSRYAPLSEKDAQ